jgi:hypothetical protein
MPAGTRRSCFTTFGPMQTSSTTDLLFTPVGARTPFLNSSASFSGGPEVRKRDRRRDSSHVVAKHVIMPQNLDSSAHDTRYMI